MQFPNDRPKLAPGEAKEIVKNYLDNLGFKNIKLKDAYKLSEPERRKSRIGHCWKVPVLDKNTDEKLGTISVSEFSGKVNDRVFERFKSTWAKKILGLSIEICLRCENCAFRKEDRLNHFEEVHKGIREYKLLKCEKHSLENCDRCRPKSKWEQNKVIKVRSVPYTIPDSAYNTASPSTQPCRDCGKPSIPGSDLCLDCNNLSK